MDIKQNMSSKLLYPLKATLPSECISELMSTQEVTPSSFIKDIRIVLSLKE